MIRQDNSSVVDLRNTDPEQRAADDADDRE